MPISLTDILLLTEDRETGGSSYEKRVADALAAAGAGPKRKQLTGSNRNQEDGIFWLTDAQGTTVGPFKLEVKETISTQLGGSSWDIRDPENIVFKEELGTSKAMRKAHDGMKAVLEEWLGQGGALKRLQRFVKNFKAGTYVIQGKKFKETKEGEEYNRSGNGLQCTPLAWAVAKDRGLILPLNRQIVAHVKYMTTLYSNKGVYYLQVGGAANKHRGLYIMGHDPANLAAIGVPKLIGLAGKNVFQIEMRATPGGSGKFRYLQIRAQGRLVISTPIPDEYSPYSLDTVEDIKRLQAAYVEAAPTRGKYLQEELDAELEESEEPVEVEIDASIPSDEADTSVNIDWLEQNGYPEERI